MSLNSTMAVQVQRFLMRAKPCPGHKTLFEWQVGDACVFVGNNDKEEAQRTAEAILRKRGFELLEYAERSTLVEERVLAEGHDRLTAAYRSAQAGEPFFVFDPDAPPIATKDGIPPVLPPRLDESFVDRVVERAGGRRLTPDEADQGRSRNADYLVNGFVVELKDIQTDPLDAPPRRDRVAGVIGPTDEASLPTVVDDLSDKAYLQVVLKAIRRRLNDAKHQVRSTRAQLGSMVRGGGVILLNTGMQSVDPEVLFEEIQRLVDASSTLDFAVLMTAMIGTNGFDTYAVFPFHPPTGGTSAVEVLRNAWGEEVDALMAEWAHGGFLPPDTPAPPLTPRAFEARGRRFSLRSSAPPSSMGRDT